MDPNSLSPWQCNESMWAQTIHEHLPRTPPYIKMSLTKHPEGTWEFKALDEYFIAVSRYGIHAFNLIDRFPAVALPAAAYVFEQGMRDLPRHKCDCALDQYTTFFKNAGTCYYQSIGKAIGNVHAHRRNLKRVWEEYIRRVREGFLGSPEDATLAHELRNLRGILDNPPFRYDPVADDVSHGVQHAVQVITSLSGDGTARATEGGGGSISGLMGVKEVGEEAGRGGGREKMPGGVGGEVAMDRERWEDVNAVGVGEEERRGVQGVREGVGEGGGSDNDEEERRLEEEEVRRAMEEGALSQELAEAQILKKSGDSDLT